MDELTTRNFEATKQALAHSNGRTDKNAEDIQKLQGAVAQLVMQVQQLTQAVNALRVMSMGRGPTS